MARRPGIVKRKPKTVRVTKSEQYVVNQKHLGDEPVFTKPLTKLDYMNALNWYNYMCTNIEAKEYLVTYLKNMGRVNEVKKIKSIPDTLVPTTIAWIARLITKGYELPVDARPYLEDRLNDICNKYIESEPKETDVEKPKVSIQERVNEKAHDILGEVEGLIDDHIEANDNFSFYDWLQANNIPSLYVSRIIDKLSPVLGELIEAYEGEDEQIKEGYRRYKKSDLQKFIKFYSTMCDDAEKYAGVAKRTRNPRKPRVQSVEKKLKSFKYQKEDNTFKIASVNPEKIIGAQELWAFNTKYKTLSVFRALDRGGLDVKGTSIIKYNEETSTTLLTGRKSEEIVKKVLEGGKLILRKIDQELKNNASLQSRINENTILLRVM